MDSSAGVNNTVISAQMRNKPLKLLRRIGSTTYEITVHYNDATKETMVEPNSQRIFL